MSIQEAQLAQRTLTQVPNATFRGGAYSEPFCEQEAPLRFRQFLLLPSERALLCKGSPVEIGSRAFDLLTILLRSRGTIVTKEEIVKYVWPCTYVEESNLRFQMASLRRALGDDRDLIKTIPGRGYLFAAEPEPGSMRQTDLTPSAPASFAVDKADRQESCLTAVHDLVRQAGTGARVAVIVLEGKEEFREILSSLLRALENPQLVPARQ